MTDTSITKELQGQIQDLIRYREYLIAKYICDKSTLINDEQMIHNVDAQIQAMQNQ